MPLPASCKPPQLEWPYCNIQYHASFQQTPLQFLTATPVKKKRMGDILDVFFSRADVYLKTYLEFSSDPTMWLNDEVISFASCWLLQANTVRKDWRTTGLLGSSPRSFASCSSCFVSTKCTKPSPLDCLAREESYLTKCTIWFQDYPLLPRRYFLAFL